MKISTLLIVFASLLALAMNASHAIAANAEAPVDNQVNDCPPLVETCTCKPPLCSCKPMQPRASLQAGEHGTVTVSLTIEASGRVSQVHILHSSGFPRLDLVTQHTLAQCHMKLEPAKDANGKAIRSTVQTSYVFENND